MDPEARAGTRQNGLQRGAARQRKTAKHKKERQNAVMNWGAEKWRFQSPIPTLILREEVSPTFYATHQD